MEQRELLVLHSRKNVVIPIPPPSEEKKAHLRMHPFGTLEGRGAAAAGEGSFLQKSTREKSSYSKLGVSKKKYRDRTKWRALPVGPRNTRLNKKKRHKSYPALLKKLYSPCGSGLSIHFIHFYAEGCFGWPACAKLGIRSRQSLLLLLLELCHSHLLRRPP